MPPTETHAERVRRWFATGHPPEPPTEDEMLALATGDFGSIDATTVAAAIAADPCTDRRFEEIRGFVEHRQELPQVARRSAVELARDWFTSRGKALAARVDAVQGRLQATWNDLWTPIPIPAPAVLTFLGPAPTSPTPAEPSPVLRLRDASGRTIDVTIQGTGYALEIDLQDPTAHGYLEIEQLDCPYAETGSFQSSAVVEAGKASVPRCPPGLHRLRFESGFDTHVLLALLPAATGLHGP